MLVVFSFGILSFLFVCLFVFFFLKSRSFLLFCLSVLLPSIFSPTLPLFSISPYSSSLSRSIHLPVYLSVYVVSVYLFCLSDHPSIYMSVRLFLHTRICLSFVFRHFGFSLFIFVNGLFYFFLLSLVSQAEGSCCTGPKLLIVQERRSMQVNQRNTVVEDERIHKAKRYNHKDRTTTKPTNKQTRHRNRQTKIKDKSHLYRSEINELYYTCEESRRGNHFTTRRRVRSAPWASKLNFNVET